MDKGAYIVRQILKMLQQNSKPSSQINDTICIQKDNQGCNIKDRRIVLRKKQNRYFKRFETIPQNISDSHIYRLFGFMGINESAIQNSTFEESYIFSHFHGRTIERVQLYDHALVVQMTEPTFPMNQPNIQYLINKFKSRGDLTFCDLAIVIEQMCSILKNLQSEPIPNQKSQPVKKWLDFLGDQMYVCTLGSRKFAISKALLRYLSYDIEQFAIEAIKYRTIFAQFFSSTSYSSVVAHLLKCLKYTIELKMNKISESQFKELTTLRFCDFIISKNNEKSYCDMTIFLLNPTYLCHKINFIYYKSEQKYLLNGRKKETSLAIEEQKEELKQEQYKTINKLIPIPRSLLQQNQKQIAKYKTIPSEFIDQFCKANLQ